MYQMESNLLIRIINIDVYCNIYIYDYLTIIISGIIFNYYYVAEKCIFRVLMRKYEYLSFKFFFRNILTVEESY